MVSPRLNPSYELRSEPRPVVRRGEVERGTERHDADGIDITVAAVIVPLDMVDAHGLGDAGNLVEIAQIVAEIRIIDDAAKIAFEMAVIDGVEPRQRREQPPIRFRKSLPDQVA